MVGDTIDADIEGPLAIGMQAVLLDRYGLHPEFAPRIESLAELRV
jgi:FMN phosphatase YigB (HAD superfamily)